MDYKMENIPRLYKLIPCHPDTDKDYEPRMLEPLSNFFTKNRDDLTDDTIIIEVPNLDIPIRLIHTLENGQTLPPNIRFFKYGMRKNYVDMIVRKYETLALFGLNVWRLSNEQLDEWKLNNLSPKDKKKKEDIIETVKQLANDYVERKKD